jgi:hypothetical protein
MVDDNPCNQSAVWGITRDDGSRRPVAESLKTAVHAFSGFERATFKPLSRSTARWPAWPEDPNSYVPNWQVYEVVFDLPGDRRVTALWNGDGKPLRVRVAAHATTAELLDEMGTPQSAAAAGTDWVIELPPATAHFAGDPAGYYFIGGAPRLLVEDGVTSEPPVVAPRLS